MFCVFFLCVYESGIDTCNLETSFSTNNHLFKIKKFEISYPADNRAGIIKYQFDAEITTNVDYPILETQIIPKENKIPVFRIKDDLCNSDILNCPSSFSSFSYKNQISLPPTLIPGEYVLRLIFREGKLQLSCYEKSFQISEKYNPSI